MKPGWKTSEFWLSGVAMVVGYLVSTGVAADGSPMSKMLGAASVVLTALGYTASRTWGKAQVPAAAPGKRA